MDKRALNTYYEIIKETILKSQNVITGLIPISLDDHAWIRDNTYAVLSVWGLALAYRKIPDMDGDRARGYELEKSVVMLMRGLLTCMMRQVDKVERFKYSQSPADSLHAKFDARSFRTVVGDMSWGHLQIDAVSLYLLTLAQMTASGIRIIWTMEEVAFIQNLVFYIEMAYRVPDYGIWERGDKTNHGITELNSSSVGMAKAALEALNELDLFGAQGGSRSIVHVMADECQQCHTVLQSVLPRESNSKETDAALLTVIGYPAFAVDDEEVIELTRNTILDQLEGEYGFKRFLRDGYKTPLEDPNRLYYEPWELRRFEGIECQWPVFFAYLVLDAHFRGNIESAQHYMKKLEKTAIQERFLMIPELYAVPRDRIAKEKSNPGSQDREVTGRRTHMWSQSLYILAKLVHEGFLIPGEIDPLGRRLVTEPKPDLVVQVVIVAEDATIQKRLAQFNVQVETFQDVIDKSGIRIFPAKILGQFYRHLGKCPSLNLSGRVTREVGILATSKLYIVGTHTLVFTPQFLDYHAFYLSLDVEFLLDLFRTDVAFLKRAWSDSGRPLFLVPVYDWFFKSGDENFQEAIHPALLATIRKLQSGYINGTRVKLGHLSEFVSTSCLTKLSFLPAAEEMIKRAHAKTGPGTRLLDPREIQFPLTQSSNMGGVSQATRSLRRKSVALTSAVLNDLTNDDNDSDQTVTFDEEDDMTVDESIAEDQLEESAHHLRLASIPSSLSMAADIMSSSSLRSLGTLTETPGEAPIHSQFARRLMSSISGGLDAVDSLRSLSEANWIDMVTTLFASDDLYEQTDILHRLYMLWGLDWEVECLDSAGKSTGDICTVRQLIKEVYERAGQMNQWWLVRFTAGLLGKRVEHLAKALADIVVCQKQVTIGLPPEPREKIITCPLPPDTLAQLIRDACGEDFTMAMLTQEILVFLSMFARTEPLLLSQVLRFRVGLILQLMASEMARTLHCTAEDASLHLFSLSPYETKLLLHNILSGKEFKATKGVQCLSDDLVRRLSMDHQEENRFKKTTLFTKMSSRAPVSAETMSLARTAGGDTTLIGQSSLSPEGLLSPPGVQPVPMDRHGQWLRRRKIDGALNRVPPGFYPRVWRVLERVEGLLVCGRIIGQGLTKEMTVNENKFALVVESVINTVQLPEFRQLIVEAISVICSIVESDVAKKLEFHTTLPVDHIVKMANTLFLEDQVKYHGDSTLCCMLGSNTSSTQKGQAPRRGSGSACKGIHGICSHFYDSSPSGRFGTITYLTRAFLKIINLPINSEGEVPIDCCLQ